jgi:branched-chain amino acid transport system ATP-binding protein
MTALEVRDLNKAFGGLRVTRTVNLVVAPGERRLIIGPNGAGKTTLFNLITGELSADSGQIMLFGRDLTAVATRRRAHLGLARTYQIITLFPGETLARNVTLSLLGLSPLRWNPFVRLNGQHDLLAKALTVNGIPSEQALQNSLLGTPFENKITSFDGLVDFSVAREVAAAK